MTPLGNKSRKTQFSCKVLAGEICIRIGGKLGVELGVIHTRSTLELDTTVHLYSIVKLEIVHT
jgi:hypothetical protein